MDLCVEIYILYVAYFVLLLLCIVSERACPGWDLTLRFVNAYGMLGRWRGRAPFINSWANIKLHLCSPAKQPNSNQPTNHSGIQATDYTQTKRPFRPSDHNRKSQSSACGPYQRRIHIFRAHIFSGFLARE